MRAYMAINPKRAHVCRGFTKRWLAAKYATSGS